MLGRNSDNVSIHSFDEEGDGEGDGGDAAVDIYGLASNPVKLTQQQKQHHQHPHKHKQRHRNTNSIYANRVQVGRFNNGASSSVSSASDIYYNRGGALGVHTG